LAVGSACAADWHVATNGSDAADGTTWATAKQTIQAGVDAAAGGDTVWVSNGVYATGGRVATGTLTNRIVIDRPIRVQSVNGRDETLIQGASGIRCAYVGTNADLSGFTLDSGGAQADWTHPDGYGGGAWCEPSGVVSDCKLSWNRATFGGGASGGTLNNCHFYVNTATTGGGAYGAVLNDCTLEYNAGENYEGGGNGGGAAESILNDCILVGNTAVYGAGSHYGTLNRCILWGNTAFSGGGASGGTLNNCVLIGNSASYAGGARNSILNNCTLFANSASSDGGGVQQCTVNNSIVYGNSARNGSNYLGSSFQYSCTFPDPGGPGNITNDPRFIDAAKNNLRLQIDSPCINAGSNALVAGMADLDGLPRVALEWVDMGAYEIPWLGGYADWAAFSITNGLTNATDCAAGDGVPNLLKYMAGNPDPMAADGYEELWWVRSGGWYGLAFNRNPYATDVTLLIQAADGLTNAASWATLATNADGAWSGAENINESAWTRPVVCTYWNLSMPGNRRILRLKVTRP
jgi:hypothetical protein